MVMAGSVERSQQRLPDHFQLGGSEFVFWRNSLQLK